MLRKARKTPLTLQDSVKEKIAILVQQNILKPVKPGGVTNATLVDSLPKKSSAPRLHVDLKVHINLKNMVKECPIPEMETTFYNLQCGSFLAKFTHQTHITIRIGRGCKKLFNQHIASNFQDVQSSSELEVNFIHPPDIHRVNSQRNQGRGFLSKWWSGIWNNKRTKRQNKCLQSKVD